MKRLFLFSLGCKVNSYETNALGNILCQRGYERELDPAKADVIILNTCAVTGKAGQKSRQHISKFRRVNATAILIVMGCYSQSEASVCAELGADIVIGGNNRGKAIELLENFDKNKAPYIAVNKNMRHENYDELGSLGFTEMSRAYLKVQDGCDNFCAYCIIPSLRGNSRSRKPGEVVKEAINLCKSGYKEIILTGIHIGAYGEDLGDGSFRLSDLIELIFKECPDLFRLRLSSIEESEVDEKLLNCFKEHKNLARHIHLPLQSGSSSVLRRMKRHYDTDLFLEKIKKIRAIDPDIAITTDVIAGFPDESEEEWKETVDFCLKAKFAEIHVFPFSSRKGTAASFMKDVDPAIKKARVGELLQISKKLRKEFEESQYGKKKEVLFEEYDENEGVSKGHTSNYLLVSIKSDKSLRGEIKEVVYTSEVAAD